LKARSRPPAGFLYGAFPMAVYRFQVAKNRRPTLGEPVLVVREVGDPFFVEMNDALKELFGSNSVIYAECELGEGSFEIKHLVDDPGWPVINPGPLR
jgi:hypothetical protein